MAKGYWIGRVDVTNPESYQKYVAANAVSFAKYGARFLIRGGRFEAVEGAARSRNVVIEFPSYQAALDCYRSPEYAEAMALRRDASEADILIIEGYDGVQPGDGRGSIRSLGPGLRAGAPRHCSMAAFSGSRPRLGGRGIGIARFTGRSRTGVRISAWRHSLDCHRRRRSGRAARRRTPARRRCGRGASHRRDRR